MLLHSIQNYVRFDQKSQAVIPETSATIYVGSNQIIMLIYVPVFIKNPTNSLINVFDWPWLGFRYLPEPKKYISPKNILQEILTRMKFAFFTFPFPSLMFGVPLTSFFFKWHIV